LSTAISTRPTAPYIVTPTDEEGNEIDLARRTVYLEFSLHALGDSRMVPRSQMDVGEAKKSRFRLSKKIVESPTLAAIISFDGKTREWLYNRSQPFKRGVYFMPLTLVDEVEEELCKRRAKREEMVAQFLAEYPDLCREASTPLTKKYYNPADYPPVENVAARFSMTWQYFKFGVPDALATVSPKVLAQERQKAAVQIREAAEDIQALMRAELLKLVSHLRNRLAPDSDGKKKKLYDSAISHLAEFLTYFDHRNVINDGELKVVVDELRGTLSGVDIEAIRNTDTLRERLCEEMSTISEQLGTLVERVPKRRITLH